MADTRSAAKVVRIPVRDKAGRLIGWLSNRPLTAKAQRGLERRFRGR